MKLSPDAMAAEIVKVSADARAADVRLIQDARDALSRSIGQVDGIVKRGQAADRLGKQRLWDRGRWDAHRHIDLVRSAGCHRPVLAGELACAGMDGCENVGPKRGPLKT